MSEIKTKTIRRFLFVYPDLRPGSQSSVIGESFEVSEADGDRYVRSPDGAYAFVVPIIKTVLDTIPDGKGGHREIAKQVRTDRRKEVMVRPEYLWVEEESFEVPTE